jgi:hypothetical protein
MARRGGRHVLAGRGEAVPVAPAVTLPAATPAPAEDRRPWQSRDVDALAGDDLRAYALRIGVSQRDCEGLTEDRLRQNCKLFIAHYFEMIAGD